RFLGANEGPNNPCKIMSTLTISSGTCRRLRECRQRSSAPNTGTRNKSNACGCNAAGIELEEELDNVLAGLDGSVVGMAFDSVAARSRATGGERGSRGDQAASVNTVRTARSPFPRLEPGATRRCKRHYPVLRPAGTCGNTCRSPWG